MRNCFLHIGTGKAGTTSIQRFMVENRDALRNRGYLYPRSPTPGRARQLMLALYARNASHWPRKPGKKIDKENFYSDFESEFASEIGQDPAPNVVLSDEALYLLKPQQIERLLSLLNRHFSKVYAIIYLRAQESHLVSRYQQTIKTGATHSLEEFYEHVYRNVSDYYKVLEKWAGYLGQDALRPRIFDPKEFKNGSLIVDFLSVLGITEYGWFQEQRPQNESLDAESVAFFRSINEHCSTQFDAERADFIRRSLVKTLAQTSSGSKMILPDNIRSALTEACAASNARIAEKYFGRTDGILFRSAAASKTEPSQNAPDVKADPPVAKRHRRGRRSERRRKSSLALL